MSIKKKYPAAYKHGYLKVSDNHRLYYECCGKRSGVPVLSLHGGPGSGFSESHKRYFDLSRMNLIFFDQRGAGRSKPGGSLKENNTWKLVDDINRLLDHLRVCKVIIAGGSWGSTLALVYAITNPDRVSALALRSVFLGDKNAVLPAYQVSAAHQTPLEWHRFISNVPRSVKKDPLSYYFRQMISEDPEIRRRFCYEFARYEVARLRLNMSDREIERELQGTEFHEAITIEASYLRNYCYLPNDYILKHARQLSGIPVAIIHGRYDLLCPPLGAYRLHRQIAGSSLVFVHSGHSAKSRVFEIPFKKALEKLVKAAGDRGFYKTS